MYELIEELREQGAEGAGALTGAANSGDEAEGEAYGD